MTAYSIEIDHLAYSHRGRSHQLVDVSLHVEPGEIACVLGPNGAGKSTLLRCVLGLVKPTGGSVRIGGVELGSLSARERALRVAYVPQDTETAFPFTTLDIAVMGRTPHLGTGRTPGAGDRRRAFTVLTDLGIDHLAEQAFTSLSGGQRSLALLARALVQESEVLILDEPTAALDLGNTMRVLAAVADLARRGHTILMTTHQPDQALHCAHRAILVADGTVTAHGKPAQILTADRLSAAYRTPIHIGMTYVADRLIPIPTCVPDFAPLTPADPAHRESSR